MSSEYTAKDPIVLEKLIERFERVITYCKGCSYDAFESNTMLQEACVFNILQIGELSKQAISDVLKAHHPEIAWRQMSGLRNRIVHGYEGVKLNIVWDTIQDDFPELLLNLKAILQETK